MGFFVRKDIVFTVREDFCSQSDDFECLTIELKNVDTRKTTICVAYRPPNSNHTNFFDYLNHSLSKLCFHKDLFYLMEDFNIDLLKDDTYNIKLDFTNLIYSFNLYPLITSATRVTEYSTQLVFWIIYSQTT